MTTSPASYGLLLGLAIALVAAAWTDVRRRRIANGLNAAIAAGAPLFWWATSLSPWPGIAWQVALAATVFLALAGLFALRVLGGGDVKLLTALALWLPWQPFLSLLLVMAVAGGVLAVLLLAWQALTRRGEAMPMPYGVAIACGGLWVIAAHYGPAVQVR
jgi:prepilin peptidase CpaA